jgi:hypothetical protein
MTLCKSRFDTVFGTYHVASVIIRNTFDWNLSRIFVLEFDADPHNKRRQIAGFSGISFSYQATALRVLKTEAVVVVYIFMDEEG